MISTLTSLELNANFLIVVEMDGGGASLWTEARPSRALIGLSWLLGLNEKRALSSSSSAVFMG